MVDVARYFLSFTQPESCGKCVPCRLGTKQMLDVLEDITKGKGKLEDLDLLQHLAESVKAGSLCALGGTAPNPVLTTLRYFREEYEDHIRHKACAAGVCRDLTAFEILEGPCNGCHLCFKACPTDAISGKPKKLHTIDQGKCIACGACFDVCPENAIRHFPRIELNQGESHV